MLVSMLSTVLLVHSWRTQMRCSQGTLPLMLWTSVLLLPMLGAIWLGLNVIRGYTYEYAADYQRHLGDYRQSLHWHVVCAQEWTFWGAQTDFVVGLLLGLAILFRRK